MILEGVEAGGNERAERLGNGKLGQLPDGPPGPVGRLEPSVDDEHTDHLDCVEGDPGGALHDRREGPLGQLRHETQDQGPHVGRLEWLEGEGGGSAGTGAPPRPPLEKLRAGERDHEDRGALRPLQQVLHEVEQAVIGRLEILEDQDGRAALGDLLEEDPPSGEEDVAVA
jgi:hypothetical protein